jgi:hypothetical protein
MDFTDWLKQVFAVYTRPQTYLNIVYLYLAFPLGLLYFICLVVGLALGFSLLIIWVGIFILLTVLGGIWLGILLERKLAEGLLNISIPSLTQPSNSQNNLWERLKAYLVNPSTWRGAAFLFLKFPIGIASFVLVTTLISISVALFLTPVYYSWVPVQVFMWQITTLPAAVAACAAGVLVGTFSLHMFNLAAIAMGKLARVMLMDETQVPAAPWQTARPQA